MLKNIVHPTLLATTQTKVQIDHNISCYFSTLYPLFSPLSPLRPYFPSTSSVPSMAFCSLFGSQFPLRPSNLFLTICFLDSPLSPPRPSVPLGPTVLSTDLCLLYSHLSLSKALCPPLALCILQRYSEPSMAQSLLLGTFPPLRPSVPSMTLCTFYSPLFPQWPSILFMAPCFLKKPSVLSTALCLLYIPYPLYGSLSL